MNLQKTTISLEQSEWPGSVSFTGRLYVANGKKIVAVLIIFLQYVTYCMYKFFILEKNFRMVVAERLFPGTLAKQLAKKVTCDQILFTPIILSCFLLINESLMGNGISGGISKIEADFTSMLVANWSVWIPAQFVNFYFMPLNYRVVFIQVVALFWNMYVSWKANMSV